MAVNDTVLNAYVEKHYGIKDSLGNFHFQEEFLDKLFHYSIELQLSHLNEFHLDGFFERNGFKDSIHKELLGLSGKVGRLTHRLWVRSLNLYESEFQESVDLVPEKGKGKLSRAGKEKFLTCVLRTVFPEAKLAFRRHGDLAFQGDTLEMLKDELRRNYENRESGQQALRILNSINELRKEGKTENV